MRNETWKLVELFENKVPIGSKLLYKSKFNEDDSIDDIKKYQLQKDIHKKSNDYEDTFAPVGKLSTIRVMIELATKHNWKIHQLDVKSSFLDGDLKE